ncbi:MAG TPA: heparan-alpha-glucosaminide N-acetyltransferase domain-containing protein, partial [Mucilaginibacter sp.]|nr:heparan-alpha-glucosaminide N-acetyltransferase domain-containing protein [Mucilaginibacter sp.]
MTAADALITPKKRIDSIDILRGIVMVIMVIDHTRDFFTGGNYDPTDLSKVSTAMFLTRFITHYCAATFVFLAGTGAYLYLNLSKGKTKGQAFSFLISRGLWLIFLELTVVNFGFSLGQGLIFLQVIWAIGCSMLVLAFLIWLPVPVITAFG